MADSHRWERYRECCDSTDAQWHSRPCLVNGPQCATVDELSPPLTDEYFVAVQPNTTYEITHSVHVGRVGIDFGYDARALALLPHRWCCGGLLTDPHLSGCPTNYFAEGQTVVKPDLNPVDPWEPARLRVREDKVSSDRTFENETRLH